MTGSSPLTLLLEGPQVTTRLAGDTQTFEREELEASCMKTLGKYKGIVSCQTVLVRERERSLQALERQWRKVPLGVPALLSPPDLNVSLWVSGRCLESNNPP